MFRKYCICLCCFSVDKWQHTLNVNFFLLLSHASLVNSQGHIPKCFVRACPCALHFKPELSSCSAFVICLPNSDLSPKGSLSHVYWMIAAALSHTLFCWYGMSLAISWYRFSLLTLPFCFLHSDFPHKHWNNLSLLSHTRYMFIFVWHYFCWSVAHLSLCVTSAASLVLCLFSYKLLTDPLLDFSEGGSTLALGLWSASPFLH